MTSAVVARSLRLGLMLLIACLGTGCETFLEGQFPAARVDVVYPNPTPDMLVEAGNDTLCFAHDAGLFVVFKELPPSAGVPEVARVDVVAPTGGHYDAAANTCTIGAFMRWRLGSRYRAIVTDGASWLARCEQSLEFFLVPPARHIIRFTVGEEGCELGVE